MRHMDVLPEGIGLMATPDNHLDAYLGRGPWAADNGAFGCWKRGEPFHTDKWWAWLNGLPTDGCLFAVAPDVVGDATGTAALSAPWLAPMRALGFPVAYVAQDGLDPEDVPWESIDWLMIGGSTDYKLSEAACIVAQVAKNKGKPVHMGRVNTATRIRHAARLGCIDTVDGTCIGFGPDLNLPRVQRWIAEANHHRSLFA